MKITTLTLIWLLAAMATSYCRAQTLAGWSMTAAGPQEQGIRAISGGDGVTAAANQGGSVCLSVTQDAHTHVAYFYFAVSDSHAPAVGKPVYVSFQYFDDRIGGHVSLQYDSDQGTDVHAHYLGADDVAGGWFMGSNTWRTVIYEMDHPRFAHEQNGSADFRLAGGNLWVRSVQLTTTRPAQWDTLASPSAASIVPRVQIGAGGQLIIGGPDSAVATTSQVKLVAGAVPYMKMLGVTSIETYVRWDKCEVAPGKFDWSTYDPYVELCRKYHLKWTAMIICGSPYSLPDWYYKHPGSQGYVCLEHHEESDVQSHWNPVFQQHVAQFMKAFCEHYGKTGLVENMLLGISGNYGEAIYAASAGTGWTADVHGPYHSHFGYWAGDPFAIADFKAYIVRKYGSPAAMQAAWGAKSPATFDAVQPFLQADAVSDRAWVDMMDWYQSSMTDWTTFWLKQTRKYFPKGGIEVCTGGDAAPQLGSNFAAQCRAAASVGGGIRITNEGSDYWVNYVVTRWIASASRQYGAFFSFEPAGAVNADGVVARIYNATASGALGLHYYYGNIFDEREATQAFIDQGSHFLQRNPIVEMGVYYPETFIELRGEKFLGKLMPLRDRFDFAYMSDTQIADGGLAGIKTLVLVDGNIAEAGTWQRIAQWVRQGGVLVYPGGMGTLKTVEGGDAPINAMLAMGGATGRGRVYRFEGLGSSTQYRQFVTQSLATAPELSLATRAMLAQDGVEDRVYATVVAPDELLWFNATHDPVTKQVGAGTLVLPAMAITGEKLQLK